MLPEEARLPHDLLQLRLQAAALEEHCKGTAEDFADLLLMVDSTSFRSVAAGGHASQLQAEAVCFA